MSHLPRVTANQVGEYIKHASCARRFKLSLDGSALAKEVPFYMKALNPLDPVLREKGRQREREWAESLRKEGAERLGPETGSTWPDLASALSLAEEGMTLFANEVEVRAEIGAFQVEGRIDFVIVRWVDGRPKLLLVECKDSRKDRTYHRAQLALYLMMARAMIGRGLNVAGHVIHGNEVEAVVARVDEDTNRAQDPLRVEPMEMELMVADLLRLLAPNGPLDRIVRTPLDELPYQISGVCDDCVYAAVCIPETARTRRLELLGMDATSARTLRDHGIRTLDDLAHTDIRGDAASAVSTHPDFSGDLETLVDKAKVRVANLPGGGGGTVLDLPPRSRGQLPCHVFVDEMGQEQDLVRVYLDVSYDYIEDRLVALAAHVTKSRGELATLDPKNGPPYLFEVPAGTWARDVPRMAKARVQGLDVVRVIRSAWSGERAKDDEKERANIEEFLKELARSIRLEAGAKNALVHFYFYRRRDVDGLMDACERLGGSLLYHLSELMGCREPLEQVIFSLLGDEVRQGYALGWTSDGLSAATALSWSHHRFHWVREVGGAAADLESIYWQRLFDFRRPLLLTDDGQWARGEDGHWEEFEIFTRHSDAVPMPYFYALWGQLPKVDGLRPREAAATEAFRPGGDAALLTALLTARAQAMRWLEERMGKNPELDKKPLDLSTIEDFSLGGVDIMRACVEFKRLDHHVKVTNWAVNKATPPAQRIAAGTTLPLKNVFFVDNNEMIAELDMDGQKVSPADLWDSAPFEEDGFVRILPYQDASYGQTARSAFREGVTCVIKHHDRESGKLSFSVNGAPPNRYVLQNKRLENYQVIFPKATMDDSVSDYVANRVEGRLLAKDAPHLREWFDAEKPRMAPAPPLTKNQATLFGEVLDRVRIDEHGIAADQKRAILEGLESRLQIMQGPPGTGKTFTTALAALVRAGLHQQGEVMLIGTQTHRAVEELGNNLLKAREPFEQARRERGLDPLRVEFMEVINFEDREEEQKFYDKAWKARLSSRLIVAGTVNGVIKFAQKFDQLMRARTLIVDEASMMSFPDFLALCTLVQEKGQIMLSGDHQQLSPILAHDWENEDRPGFRVLQPHRSAFDTVRDLAAEVKDGTVRSSALDTTYRLPQELWELVGRVYEEDGIEFKGVKGPALKSLPPPPSPLQVIWQTGGLFLITHSECRSKKVNRFESELIQEVMRAAGPQATDSVAVITPHRLQRSLLNAELKEFIPPVGVIDTVEKLQGGERETVIVSGTQSEPGSIAATAEFILDKNRSNVLFSRAKHRLLIICSRSLLDAIPPDMEAYDAAFLWKEVRERCNLRIHSDSLGGIEYSVMIAIRRSDELIDQGEKALDALQAAVAGDALAELLKKGESRLIEFKPAFRNDPKMMTWDREGKERNLTMECMEAVAGFANSDTGGVLAVGVDKMGVPIGLDNEMRMSKNSEDQFLQDVTRKLNDHIDAYWAQAARLQMREVGGKKVLLLIVKPADNAVFVTDAKAQRHFYVRQDNKTQKLGGAAQQNYIKKRFWRETGRAG